MTGAQGHRGTAVDRLSRCGDAGLRQGCVLTGRHTDPVTCPVVDGAPAWAAPLSTPGTIGYSWTLLGQALAAHGITRPRTTSALAGDWAEQALAEAGALASGEELPWRQGVPRPAPSWNGPISAVLAGIAPADLYAVHRSSRLTHKPGHPVTIARRLQEACSLEMSCLSTRAAIGWLCAEDTIGPLGRDDPDRYEHLLDWTHAGLGEIGWLYAAAGFTLNETLKAKRAATLDPVAAAMMAGLRGVRLPAR